MADVEQDDMPPVYDIRFLPSELKEILRDILGSVSTENVTSTLASYVRASIEPVGWKAIWRPAFLADISLLVYVNDVDCDHFEASVIVKDLVHPKANMLGPEQTAQVQSMIDSKEHQSAPLHHMQVVCCEDYDIDYYKTACLVELLRFFYQHIWMPWDDFEKEHNATPGGDFFTTKLKPRMDLVCDMKSGGVSSTLIKRYHTILEDAAVIRQKYDELNKRAQQTQQAIELNESIGNLKGDELNTVTDFMTDMDAIECVRNRMKLEDYEREVNILEDQHLRTVYHTLRPGYEDQPDGPAIHLVADSFNFHSLSNIMNQLSTLLKDNAERAQWPIRLHLTLHKAIGLAASGDVIYIAPGTYTQSLSWIEKNLEIHGLPGGEGVQLVSHAKSGDIFLFFDIPHEVKICNVTMRAGAPLSHMVVVKSGRLVLDNCTIDCCRVSGKPVIRVNNAQVDKRSTKFITSDHLSH